MTDLQRLVGRFRQWAERSAGTPTDGELLRRYVQDCDAAAFEVLVWRHGTLVYNVCRRLLRHEPDVEDAFQATFVVLARKAHTISERDALAHWLYRVAVRIAWKLHARRA